MDKISQLLEEVRFFIDTQTKFLSLNEHKEFLECLLSNLEGRLDILQMAKKIEDLFKKDKSSEK